MAPMNASTAHLSPIETCRFWFPSTLLLMVAVVITACRPSGISGLILVLTPQATGSFMCQPWFHHKGGNSTWRNTFKLLKYVWTYPENGNNKKKCAVCAGWVGDLGALNFNTAQQHLHTVFRFGLHPQQKRKEMCDRAYWHSREEQQGQSRVQQ